MRITTTNDSSTVALTDGAEGTRLLAERLAAMLVGGEVIGLRGDLGAGKTVFVQGLARGLGVGEAATSPSFVLIHEYHGRLAVCHADLYRLAPQHADDLGIEDLMTADAVVVIEWAERLPEHLRRRLCLDIEIGFGAAELERRIRMAPMSAVGSDIVRGLSDPAPGRKRSSGRVQPPDGAEGHS